MDQSSILDKLQDLIPELSRRGVKSLAVFGSVARGSQTEASDLDLLVDFSYPIGLFEFIRIKNYIEKMTGYRVDLVTLDAIRPEMKDQILKEAIDVR